MSDTPTPRTDKWEYEQECNYEVAWEDNCRQLERELGQAHDKIEELVETGLTQMDKARSFNHKLAEATKQRDALAEALSPFVTLNPLSKRVQEKWHGYVLNAKQALAATKGGSHE
jgi:hypothetical protein